MEDSLPLDLGFLEIDEQTHGPSRSPQIVETLRNVCIGEMLSTFQLYDQHIFHKKISKVLTHALALVGNWKGDLSSRPKAPKP